MRQRQQTRQDATYRSRKSVQTTGASSDLASMSPTEIRDKNLFPKGFYPLPHPNQLEGGMVFPKFEINEVLKQEGRNTKSLNTAPMGPAAHSD